MNPVEINKEIENRLTFISSSSELEDLKKWAKKEKKKVTTEPCVTAFKRVNYDYWYKVRSQGSGRVIGDRLRTVQYTTFTYLGIEIRIDELNNQVFDESDFDKSPLWIDRHIKYGGCNYYPKSRKSQFFGRDFRLIFLAYVKSNGFFILNKVLKNGSKSYLCNYDDRSCIKMLVGRRLTSFDKCNKQCAIISDKSILDWLELESKGWDSFF